MWDVHANSRQEIHFLFLIVATCGYHIVIVLIKETYIVAVFLLFLSYRVNYKRSAYLHWEIQNTAPINSSVNSTKKKWNKKLKISS
jgi:hypothetical protein